MKCCAHPFRNAALFVILPTIILTIIGLVLPISSSTTYHYEGKVMLFDGDYEVFKQVIARDDVVIHKLESLSSDSHFVQFSLDVPKGIPFPWGKANKEPSRFAATLISGAIGMAIGLLAAGVYLIDEWDNTRRG